MAFTVQEATFPLYYTEINIGLKNMSFTNETPNKGWSYLSKNDVKIRWLLANQLPYK